MGEANRRGTFEKRRDEAIARKVNSIRNCYTCRNATFKIPQEKCDRYKDAGGYCLEHRFTGEPREGLESVTLQIDRRSDGEKPQK